MDKREGSIMSEQTPSDGTAAVKEVGEYATRQFLAAAAAGLPSSGTLIDDGTNRVRFAVEETGQTDRVAFRLVLSDNLWGWKSMPISTDIVGNWVRVRELGVNSNQRIATVGLTTDDLAGAIKLDFWKHGVLGFGAWVTALVIDVSEHLGKRITYIWEED
jgi:hypothetical protein